MPLGDGGFGESELSFGVSESVNGFEPQKQISVLWTLSLYLAQH